MFTEKDRKMLSDAMIGNIYLLRAYKADNGWLYEKCDNLLDSARKAEVENANLRAKVDIYEKVLSKMIGSSDNNSDSTFMIDGDIYLLSEYTIDVCQDGKTLDAHFICKTGVTKDFK